MVLSKSIILREIGRGCFGVVYLVNDTQILKARKVVQMKESKQREKKELIEIEVNRRLSSSNNNNTVKLYDYYIDYVNMLLYIDMEFCNDGNLYQRLKYNAQNKILFTQSEILMILVDILNGLRELQAQHIIHRDIKPNNIFVHKITDTSKLNTSHYTYKIGDFGCSIIHESDQPIKSCNVYGNAHYTSPEIFYNLGYDHSCDIWSVGCILYELVFKRHVKNLYYKIENISDFYTEFHSVLVDEVRDFLEENSEYQDICHIILNTLTTPDKRLNIDEIFQLDYIQSYTKNINFQTSDNSFKKVEKKISGSEFPKVSSFDNLMVK